MLNSLRELSGRSNSSATELGESDAAAGIEPLLSEEESIAYIMRTGTGIEYTTDDRTTTVEPGGDHDAVGVVTDHRLLFLVESDADEPVVDVEVALETVTLAERRDGLLSTSFVVVDEGTDTVKFTPSGDPNLEAVADYVDRVGSSWAELHRALAATRDAIDEFEECLRRGEDAHETLTTARSRLSNAHHCATRNDDGPVEAMLALVEPVEAELDDLEVDARLDRVDELLADARRAREDEFAAAVEALAEAAGLVDEASNAIDSDDAISVVDERAEALVALLDVLCADAEATAHRAQDADDPTAAANAWTEALDRYRSLATTDWNGLLTFEDDGLRYQLAWVVGRRVDALADEAAALEAAADDLGEGHDDAADRYQAAREAVETARALAREHPHCDPRRFAEVRERLDEKRARSEWEWGGT